VKIQALDLSIGTDFPSLNCSLAEVTLSLVFMVNVAFSPCLIGHAGSILMLLNTPSLMG